MTAKRGSPGAGHVEQDPPRKSKKDDAELVRFSRTHSRHPPARRASTGAGWRSTLILAEYVRALS